jgi:hypothetical protein
MNVEIRSWNYEDIVGVGIIRKEKLGEVRRPTPSRGFYQATYNDPVARDGCWSVVITYNWQQLAAVFVAMAASCTYNEVKLRTKSQSI